MSLVPESGICKCYFLLLYCMTLQLCCFPAFPTEPQPQSSSSGCLSHPFSSSLPPRPAAPGSGKHQLPPVRRSAARASRPSFPRAAPEQPARSGSAGRATERRWGGLSGCRCAAASGWGHSGQQGLGRGFRSAGRHQL